MDPVLVTVFGFPIQYFGLSKGLAVLVAGWVLARAFGRRGLPTDAAWSLVIWVTVWGFAGAKLYYLAEHAGTLMPGDFTTMGFTWYGGVIGGTAAALTVIWRRRLPLGLVGGLMTVPLALAYGIGRLGCLMAGDGTYGRPTDLPWGMAFPNGTVPTMVVVHPTPLYEALASFVLAALLWWLGRHAPGPALLGTYLVLSGTTRFAVEFLRINRTAWLGLTQPQVWSLLLAAVGAALLIVLALRRRLRRHGEPAGDPGVDAQAAVLS